MFLMYGIDKLFAQELDVDVEVAPFPSRCAGKCATVALNKMRLLDSYGYRFKTKEEVRIR